MAVYLGNSFGPPRPLHPLCPCLILPCLAAILALTDPGLPMTDLPLPLPPPPRRLQVIREHFLSRLPVEVMWQGPQEMDKKTWGSIESMFAPIRGVDITNTPHPVPQLHRK